MTIESPAFRTAALQSERLRIVALIFVLLILLLWMLFRNLLWGSLEQRQLVPLMLGIVGGLFVYEAVMCAAITRGIRLDREPPKWMWTQSVFVETLLPTIGLLILADSGVMTPYQALVAPVVLVYFLFIILSTLRLSPHLCMVTGVCSAGGYAFALIYTFRRYPQPADPGQAFTVPIYATYAVFLLLGGLTAGAVAARIRKHVLAALREAETQRQVERLERDLDIAREIQQGLLPRRPPRLAGFDIAGWNKPADQTGGDYFDWQELPGERLVVSLADVTGHGIGPALVTAACRAYSRASFLGEEELGRLIDRIHHLLAEDLPSDRFVTFVAALVGTASEKINLLSAGHGPIFLYSARDHCVLTRNADDLPFGVVPENQYGPAKEIEFRRGDMLVLITDGFFEWTNEAGEPFGIERLSESIRASHDLPADKVIERIRADVLAFAGGTSQQDDLTVVVIKRT